MNRKLKLKIIQYMTYTVLLLLLFLAQTTPGLLSIAGVKPLLVLPAVVALAMQERELAGGLMGGVGGLLCDLTSFTYFGFNAILFLVVGVTVGLLVEYLIKNSLFNALLLSFGAVSVVMICTYFFQYGVWDYEGSGRIFWFKMMPQLGYTMLFAPLLFWLFRALNRAFAARINV